MEIDTNEIIQRALKAPSFCSDIAKEASPQEVSLSILRSLGDVHMFLEQCFPTPDEEKAKVLLRLFKTLKHHKIDAIQSCSILAHAAQAVMMIIYKNNLEKEEQQEVNNG